AAAAMTALGIVGKEPHRRTELLARANSLRKRLADQGWNVGDSASQIIPVIVGEPERAVALGAALRERGFFVPAIRPPTVPSGTARLRINLSSAHSQDLVDRLAEAMEELRDEGVDFSLPS
ncbi:MAG: aminotransferase class I/II-fold pyridoxal phosphate-dependent enzyme, partial [Planctomycetota bacterium]